LGGGGPVFSGTLPHVTNELGLQVSSRHGGVPRRPLKRSSRLRRFSAGEVHLGEGPDFGHQARIIDAGSVRSSQICDALYELGEVQVAAAAEVTNDRINDLTHRGKASLLAVSHLPPLVEHLEEIAGRVPRKRRFDLQSLARG
jgi:hypothetical protein